MAPRERLELYFTGKKLLLLGPNRRNGPGGIRTKHRAFSFLGIRLPSLSLVLRGAASLLARHIGSPKLLCLPINNRRRIYQDKISDSGNQHPNQAHLNKTIPSIEYVHCPNNGHDG